MPPLPTGAVTFLFTDIEGSTRLVKQLRDRYADVLADHQRLLRDAFEAHRGHEVDTQGDSFFVAFASARDALLAAVAGQRALRAHPWPAEVEIKVRMGLHTGQAIAAGGRYTGLAVHRAARIGAAGHGGQILVSQATQTLLEDEEEDLQVHLVDLGEQRLKDLDRPVRLLSGGRSRVCRRASRRSARRFPRLAEPAPARRLLRRPWGSRAALLVLGALVAGAAALALRGDPASVTAVPNAVAVIEPNSGRVVDVVPVGTRPGPIAFGAGSIWVGNLDDRNVTRSIRATGRCSARSRSDHRTPTGARVRLRRGVGRARPAGQVSRIDPQFNDVSPPIDLAGTAFGFGTTTLAVNAAVALATGAGKKVTVLDLDLAYGNAARMLALQPERTLADLAADDRISSEALDELTLEHRSGVKVVVGCDQPEHASTVGGLLVRWTIEQQLERSDVVLVDTASWLSEATLAVLPEATTVCVVTTPRLVALEATSACLSLLERLGVGRDRARLVLNNTTRGPEAGSRGERLERPVDLTIPFLTSFGDATGSLRPLDKGQSDQVGAIVARDLATRVISFPLPRTGVRSQED